jgi:hypothetical protein
MCYLSPHSKREQDHPIEEEYRPENRDIKRTKESHHKSNAKCLRDRVPAHKRKLSSFSKKQPSVDFTK